MRALWRRVSTWLWDQWWTGLAVCSLAGAMNIVLAYRTESIPELWVNLLSAGWVIGWGMYSFLYQLRLKREAITRAQIVAEAEEFISNHADAWARESIRRVMIEARRQGVLPPNIEVYLADEVEPPGFKH